MTSYKRWTVEYEDDVFQGVYHRRGFSEDQYADAVILAKIKGTNCIYDRLEQVFIDL
jgi:hypothetical protein